MKTIIPFFIILIFINGNFASAQEEKKCVFGIGLGSAAPIGNFSSINYSKDRTGYALPGVVLDISFSYRFIKKIGFCLLFRGQNNPYDTDAKDNDLTMIAINRTYEADSWKVASHLGGFYFSTPLTQSMKVCFDARAMLGFATAASPTIRETIISSTTYWIEEEASGTVTGALLLGGGFRFNFGKTFSLLLNTDMLFMNADFRKVKIVSSDGITIEQNYSQQMSTASFTVGMGFRL
jgi:hypothetical protein